MISKTDEQLKHQLDQPEADDPDNEKPRNPALEQSQQQFQTAFIQKQQSLDTYLQLKYVESNKESEPQPKTTAGSVNPLICIQDQSQIPVLKLQLSPRSYKPMSIKIVSYRTSTFMGVATQIFALKVTDSNPSPAHEYELERRFSDFADLYEQLFYNQPGYILHPFPEKTLQSYIKIKLNISISKESAEKLELVERRMKGLEDFVNWVARHKELCNSEEFLAFVKGDAKVYEEEKMRLNKFVEENKGLLAGSQLKNIVDMGKSMINSYFNNQISTDSPPSPTNLSQSLTEAYQQIQSQKQTLSSHLQLSHLLLHSQKQLSQFLNLNTDIDILLKISAMHDSSKGYSHQFAIYLECLVEGLGLLVQGLDEAQKSLACYHTVRGRVAEAKAQLDLERMAKLQRMAERIQKNFNFDWPPFMYRNQQAVKMLEAKLRQQWQEHKQKMRKVWRNK